jgi:hypothetical protein
MPPARTPANGRLTYHRGQAPIDLITAGRANEVIAALELLADGAPL